MERPKPTDSFALKQKYVVFLHEVDHASSVVDDIRRRVDTLTSKGVLQMYISTFLSEEVSHIIISSNAKRDSLIPPQSLTTDSRKRKVPEASEPVATNIQSPSWSRRGARLLQASTIKDPPAPVEDPITLACKRGAKVITFQVFYDWLVRQCAKCERYEGGQSKSLNGAHTSPKPIGSSVEIPIRIEICDIDRQWRTLRMVYKHEDVKPPFLARVERYISKCDPPDVPAPPQAIATQPNQQHTSQIPVLAHNKKKSGYCEYCKVAFPCYFEHIASNEHKISEQEGARFEELDALFSSLPLNQSWTEFG
eukprot:TRINITY_DN3156_c0_g2_i3.p1 TRINITY_DN3156_c0_g2~~TRINITY_DN3156_c0_g2_i3.p1  ORF type:complete len:308 (+),score=48.43 TRINITY_DN3156_c0_g2_i3:85-1008(+)